MVQCHSLFFYEIQSAKFPLITDFTSGEDVLGIAGLGIGFDDLNITGQDDNTLIAANGSDLAILQGIGADSLIMDNFLFAGSIQLYILVQCQFSEIQISFSEQLQQQAYKFHSQGKVEKNTLLITM